MTDTQDKDYQDIPNVDTMKGFFKAGAIPNQGQFENLVLLADYCRHVLNALPQTSGLKIQEGSLALKLQENSGLTLNENGLASTVSALSAANNSGLEIDNSEISIKTPNSSGLKLDTNGLSVSLSDIALGIVSEDSGVEVDNENKIALKLADNTALKVDKDGLALDSTTLIKGAKGLKVLTDALELKIKSDTGLILSADGLALKLATNQGLSLTNKGLAVSLADDSGLNFNGGALNIDWANVVPASEDAKPSDDANALLKKLWDLENRLKEAEDKLEQMS